MHLLAPFNAQFKKGVEGRKESLKRLKKFKENNTQPIVWFHAASLGEFEQGLPLMEAIKKRNPNLALAVTFFSPSGYELRKTHPLPDFVGYLPFDTPKEVQAYIDVMAPKQVFFIKYEFWWHVLHTLSKKKIPVYCISAHFTPQHIFFRFYGGLHRKMLHFFDHIFVQTESSVALLHSIGIHHVSVSGDTRFDRVVKTIEQPQRIQILEAFKTTETIMVAGSVWPEDMQVLNEFINSAAHHIKIIIAPHQIDEKHIDLITQGLQVPYAFFSGWQPDETARVMILNTIGHLANAYRYGDFAYVGGAFGDGLHNILEPAAFGLPLVFGNQGLGKFPEANSLAELGGAFPIANATEAHSQLEKLKADTSFRTHAGEINRQFVKDRSGATSYILDHIEKNER